MISGLILVKVLVIKCSPIFTWVKKTNSKVSKYYPVYINIYWKTIVFVRKIINHLIWYVLKLFKAVGSLAKKIVPNYHLYPDKCESSSMQPNFYFV